jgi:hypothetical protein
VSASFEISGAARNADVELTLAERPALEQLSNHREASREYTHSTLRGHLGLHRVPDRHDRLASRAG